MKEIYGNYVEFNYINGASEETEFLIINFSPTLASLQQRWRNNGLSADFLADYLSTFFPGDDNESLNRRANIQSGVSYVANELLENAMKFNFASAKHSISISMELQLDKVLFYASNIIEPSLIVSFRELIQRLLTENPNELYMEKLMENEEDDVSSSSGLGYLTMINDWNAKLAWKFEISGHDLEAHKVTVMVELPFS